MILCNLCSFLDILFSDESELDYFKTGDFDSALLNDFNKYIRHFLLTAPVAVDSKVHWFPDEVSFSYSRLS